MGILFQTFVALTIVVLAYGSSDRIPEVADGDTSLDLGGVHDHDGLGKTDNVHEKQNETVATPHSQQPVNSKEKLAAKVLEVRSVKKSERRAKGDSSPTSLEAPSNQDKKTQGLEATVASVELGVTGRTGGITSVNTTAKSRRRSHRHRKHRHRDGDRPHRHRHRHRHHKKDAKTGNGTDVRQTEIIADSKREASVQTLIAKSHINGQLESGRVKRSVKPSIQISKILAETENHLGKQSDSLRRSRRDTNAAWKRNAAEFLPDDFFNQIDSVKKLTEQSEANAMLDAPNVSSHKHEDSKYSTFHENHLGLNSPLSPHVEHLDKLRLRRDNILLRTRRQAEHFNESEIHVTTTTSAVPPSVTTDTSNVRELATIFSYDVNATFVPPGVIFSKNKTDVINNMSGLINRLKQIYQDASGKGGPNSGMAHSASFIKRFVLRRMIDTLTEELIAVIKSNDTRDTHDTQIAQTAPLVLVPSGVDTSAIPEFSTFIAHRGGEKLQDQAKISATSKTQEPAKTLDSIKQTATEDNLPKLIRRKRDVDSGESRLLVVFKEFPTGDGAFRDNRDEVNNFFEPRLPFPFPFFLHTSLDIKNKESPGIYREPHKIFEDIQEDSSDNSAKEALDFSIPVSDPETPYDIYSGELSSNDSDEKMNQIFMEDELMKRDKRNTNTEDKDNIFINLLPDQKQGDATYDANDRVVVFQESKSPDITDEAARLTREISEAQRARRNSYFILTSLFQCIAIATLLTVIYYVRNNGLCYRREMANRSGLHRLKDESPEIAKEKKDAPVPTVRVSTV